MSAASDPITTYVLTSDAVRWGIRELGAQKLHPTFVMYLYLRVQQRAGRLAEASASSDELLALIRMPGNPAKPYYFPLIERGNRTGEPLPTFWRSPNIPGSWSPGSLGRQVPASWLTSGGGYTLPDDHVDRAFRQMLYEQPISALALGAYFLRNDGFVLSGDPVALDVVAAFRLKFDYPVDADREFSLLFTAEPLVDVAFDWFEPFDPQTGEDIAPSGEQEGTDDV